MIIAGDPHIVVRLAQKLPYFFGIEIYEAPVVAEIRPNDYQDVIDRRTHRPRGSMCQRCVSQFKDCSRLPFERMRVIGKDAEGLKVVICESYTPNVIKRK